MHKHSYKHADKFRDKSLNGYDILQIRKIHRFQDVKPLEISERIMLTKLHL